MIKQNSKGEYVLVSLRTGKIIGTYKSREAAQNKQNQLRYVKVAARRKSRYA